MNKDLALLLPRDKQDIESAAALTALDLKKTGCITWMQDINWLVATVFQPFLVDAGASLPVNVKPLLLSEDNE